MILWVDDVQCFHKSDTFLGISFAFDMAQRFGCLRVYHASLFLSVDVQPVRIFAEEMRLVTEALRSSSCTKIRVLTCDEFIMNTVKKKNRL